MITADIKAHTLFDCETHILESFYITPDKNAI